MNNTRLTVPAGVTRIRLIAQQFWQSAAGGIRQLEIYKNGASAAAQLPRPMTEIESGSVGTNAITSICSPIMDVVGGDYFETFAYHSYAATISFIGSRTFFSMEIIE